MQHCFSYIWWCADPTGPEDVDAAVEVSPEIVDVDDVTSPEVPFTQSSTEQLKNNLHAMLAPLPMQPTTILPDIKPIPSAVASNSTVTKVSGPHQYPKQEAIANQCFQQIKSAFESMGKPKMSDSYDSVEFWIMLPELFSIYEQTIIRVNEFLDAYRTEHPGFQAGREAKDIVFRASLGKDSLSAHAAGKLKEIQRRIKSSKHTLFVIIHDEAHWAATLGGGADQCINNGTVRLSENVVTLFVSATPYSLVTSKSQVPKENEVNWFEENEITQYYGIKEYVAADDGRFEPGRILTDDVFNDHAKKKYREWCKNAGKEKNTEITARTEALLEEYIASIKKFMGVAEGIGTTSEYTDIMVTRLLTPSSEGKGVMILMRVLYNKLAAHVYNALLELQKELSLTDRFAVVLDVNTKTSGLHGAVPKELLKHAQTWSNNSELKIRKYEDLIDIPCILILCEKGKMGDTFPKSMAYYDMRLRYGNSVSSRASVEQDLGRACRYNVKGDGYALTDHSDWKWC